MSLNGNCAEPEPGGGEDDWDDIIGGLNTQAIAPEEIGEVYNFKNISVRFPYKAYQSQLDMMEKIIEGVTTKQNCLLESPTGTGKTAALLCSLLAWQQDLYDKRRTRDLSDLKGSCTCEEDSQPAPDSDPISYPRTPPASPQKPKPFPSPSKKFKGGVKIEDPGEEPTLKDHQLCSFCVKKLQKLQSYLKRPPKIYYLTRTHSQITQVVKQLKNTYYKSVKMTILSSRGPTCITNLPKEDSQTLNDVCGESKKKYWKAQNLKRKILYTEDGLSDVEKKALEELEKGICKHHFPFIMSENSKPKKEFANFQDCGAWDLEDMKGYGGSCEKCPYFGCYSLHGRSDIVFCSYNYVIDPTLREYTQIQFDDAVLVFDEAHNIEDICRDAFTLTLDIEEFDEEMRKRVDDMVQLHADGKVTCDPKTIMVLNKTSALFKKWSDFVKTKANWIKAEEEGQISFQDGELKKALEEMEMKADVIEELIEELKQDESQMDDKYINRWGVERAFRIPGAFSVFLKKLLLPLDFVFKKEVDGIGGLKDFRGFVGKRRKPDGNPKKDFLLKFELVCLNPAVGFKALRDSAYSIIVASGTLTPLDSFSGELATDFKLRLQAKHVIPKENVFAAVLGDGPGGVEFKLNHTGQHDDLIQDGLGEALCKICEVVPNGVLIFLPSYDLMNKLKRKWEGEGKVLNRIRRSKKIFYEQANKWRFLEDMERFKREVKGGDGWDGCVMFAVFRGKISEGIDFADEQARAVVTIGIPYANFGAPSVSSKKDYNDMRRLKGDKLMRGQEWYKMQAFRAMNQGIGRCVRHKDDWGALILIDKRLSNNQKYISKWVCESLNETKANLEFQGFLDKLGTFMEGMKRKERRQGKIDYEDDEIEMVLNSSSEYSFDVGSDFSQ